MEDTRDEFKIRQRRPLREEEAAHRATDGIPTKPEQRLGLRFLKPSSHHWVETGLSEKLAGRGLLDGGENNIGSSDEELTETK